jgi:cytidylate kinase
MEGVAILEPVVFPDAPLKVFLIADPSERARRRFGQEEGSGRRRIWRRRQRKSEPVIGWTRKEEPSPLRPAADAVEIDSTALTADEVVDRITELARQRGLVRDQGRYAGAPEK